MVIDPSREPDVIHRLRNQLGVIIGFCNLLLESSPVDETLRGDIQSIQSAAEDALALIPTIAARLRADDPAEPT